MNRTDFLKNNKVIREYELIPKHTNQKSFYRKAIVLETETEYYLQSYETIVCSINKSNNQFTRLWNDWSSTTGKHIHDFAIQFLYGYPEKTNFRLNKKTWLEMEVA